MSRLLENILRNWDGPLGQYLRYRYYRGRLGKCGKQVKIETGVFLTNPAFIELGDNVWIDKNTILIAGKVDVPKDRMRRNQSDDGPGVISIGSDTHLGIGTIIQGHCGVHIGNCFTTSAGCKLYSLSNDVSASRSGTMKDAHYVATPIHIGHNVWLGLGVTVVGARIGDDCFVKPNAVVTRNLEPNSIAGGNPASRTKERFTSDKN